MGERTVNPKVTLIFWFVLAVLAIGFAAWSAYDAWWNPDMEHQEFNRYVALPLSALAFIYFIYRGIKEYRIEIEQAGRQTEPLEQAEAEGQLPAGDEAPEAGTEGTDVASEGETIRTPPGNANPSNPDEPKTM